MKAYRKPLLLGLGGLSLLLLAGGWVLVPDDEDSDIDRLGEGLTVADVYRNAENHLRKSGGVHKVTIEIEIDFGSNKSKGVVQRWVDPERNVAREEQDSGANVRILTSEALYRSGPSNSLEKVLAVADGLWICHSAGVSASMLLGCPRVPEESSTVIHEGEYSGKPAVVLVTEGKREGSDQTHTFIEKLYLDPNTFLPIAMENDGEVDRGEITPLRELWTYSYETLSDQLPENFFGSTAPARPAPDKERAARIESYAEGMLGRIKEPVYWLGTFPSGAGALPDLELNLVGQSGRFTQLNYMRAGVDGQSEMMTLQVFTPSAWESYKSEYKTQATGPSPQAPIWEDPCSSREEMAIKDGQATIYSCPAEQPTVFSALADMRDAVVLVVIPSEIRTLRDGPAPPGTPGGPGSSTARTPNPYSTREGTEMVLRSLEKR